MTKTNSHAPLPMSLPRAHSDTIYRDTPFAVSKMPFTRPRFPRVRAGVLPDERVSDGILLVLAALLLPTVAYSFAQMWNLISGGSLEYAVRAFFP